MDNRKKLREKIKQKRENRASGSVHEIPSQPGQNENLLNKELDFVKMMDQVNNILKTNPAMVKQVSKCVSNVMGNPELMKSLVGQVEQEIHEDQTFESNKLAEDFEASIKDPKQ
jgi:GTP-sensing pleiotropic transcriptional regulator CodY